MNTEHPTYIVEIGENIAAIASAIHENGDTYQNILEQLPNDAGGFVGIWELCAVAGHCFFIETRCFQPDSFYWIEAIEGYADQIIGYLLCGTVPDKATLHRLATGNIEKNLHS